MLSLRWLRFLTCCFYTCVLTTQIELRAEDKPMTEDFGFRQSREFATSATVGGKALLHTRQVVPLDRNGEVVGKTAEEQAKVAFSMLRDQLKADSSSSARIIKLNVYVANPTVAAEIDPTLSNKYAISFVETKLPGGAFVALDAIGIVDESKRPTKTIRSGKAGMDGWAVLPVGPRVYISGQAEKGADLRDATTKTLDSLLATLRHLKLEQEQVVQVKCFLTPMADVKKVEEAIVEHFKGSAPPCVFVEWQSTLPIEIEMIVADPVSDASSKREPLEFITPPGMTASPVFCRVVRVNHPQTIFVSGLFAKNATDGAGQVTQVFDQLQDILKSCGSDMRHLAKATYYVSDNDASTKLNEIRPKFYDPQRPPAASKAQVFGVGMPSRSLTLDMIAVPAK